ncbi:LysR family transcriptional regulator [Pseudoruegeria sp. SHC-113]|uniref:LysR family transcriptional regulator n=1 Tax=Pseudoruegeria sp. SHC-113 TaxID=2855439 RepID=UPI0021BB074F|nr:LysR family transcriptional regulator [Pseudoruegeria sp. SHC-113]MCT8159415.1 LysR family transcriptional regulator [Pseudoruegeria sp. SHC-113]
MLNISQLHHLQLLAETGSFALAAEQANITQPALSNSIKALETRVGLQLVERSKRPVRLTPMGETLLERIGKLLFEARNLEQEINNLASGESGTLRVGMTAVFSTSLGGPIVAEFHNAHPGIALDVRVAETTQLVPMLEKEEIDLLIGDTRDLPPSDARLQRLDLPAQAGGAFCRPGHPMLSLLKPRIEDLASYHFATTHLPADVISDFTARLAPAPDGRARIAVNSHNIALLRDAVAESDLILLTTRGCVRNMLALGLLAEIPVDLGIDGTWAMMRLANRVGHPALPVLWRKVQEVAQRERDKRLTPYAANVMAGRG